MNQGIACLVLEGGSESSNLEDQPGGRENKWSQRPPHRKCSICWYPIDPQEAIIEERATGEDAWTERWLYCKACWD